VAFFIKQMNYKINAVLTKIFVDGNEKIDKNQISGNYFIFLYPYYKPSFNSNLLKT